MQRVINSPPRGIGKQTVEEIARRANDDGLSLWETISLVIEKPENLSTRAVAALRSFRRIIVRLGELAGVQDNTQATLSRGQEGRLAPALTHSDSPVSDIVKAAILDTGYENALKSEKTDEAEARLENLQELVNAAVDYDEQGIEGLREFIDHSALVSDADQYKEEAVVTLMTAHSAKGLEFPLVFIVGLEDGLFPHSRSATDPAELEEERRLCYVAMTRAERFLYVTHAMKRRVYGEELASEPSQFLNEMPLDLMEDLSSGKSWLSFARGSSAIDYEQGEYRKERKKFTGKTYDSVDSIAEFFKQRATQLGNTGGSFQSAREREERNKSDRARAGNPPIRTGSGPGSADGQPGWGGGSDRDRGGSSSIRTASGSNRPDRGGRPNPNERSSNASQASKLETRNSKPETPSEFVPGSYVKHSKYGRGLVLRREGVGDSLKLTVTFPGYGQKKLVQKYAGLEKA